jgi:hypothetical protein
MIALTGDARHLERLGNGCVPGTAHLVQSGDGGLKLGLALHAPIAYVLQMDLRVDETKSIIAALPGVANELSCNLPAEIND